MTHTVFEPSTSALGDFELRVRRSLERQAAVRSIGARIESVTAGRAVVAMAHRPELTQQHGFVHAGIVSTALGACRALGRARVGPARGRMRRCKCSPGVQPGRALRLACAPLQGQPDGPGRFALPAVVAGSLCGSATPPRQRLGWQRDSPRRGPDPTPDRLLDSACGYAAFSLMPDDAAVLTIEFKVNFLAPARGPQLRFEGNVTKAGRTITVVDGQAFEFEHGERSVPKRIATMIATIMTVRGREGLQD